MLLGSNLRHAFRSLARRPVRSFLVLQGIAWGVGIAIFPAAVLEGSRKAAWDRAEEVGTGRVSLLAEPGSPPLDVEDLAFLRKGLAGYQVYEAAPVRVAVSREPTSPTLIATDVSGARVRYQKVARGRYLEARDEAAGAQPVCVLEPGAAELLRATGDPLGRKAHLPGGIDAEVVGILAPRSERALRTDDFGLETGHRMENRVWSLLQSFGVSRPDDSWKRTDG